jgi:hypothetical protein
MLGTKPREYTLALEKGDHPLIDALPGVDKSEIKMDIPIYPGANSLRQFDIQTITMLMT